MAAVGEVDGVPARCRCGAEWTWRQVWWDAPGQDPRWGYLMHCAARHFHWFECEVDAGELEHARRRFGAGPGPEGIDG